MRLLKVISTLCVCLLSTMIVQAQTRLPILVDAELAQIVDREFYEAHNREYFFTALDSYVEKGHGEQLLPFLAKYLEDPRDGVRRELVRLIEGVRSPLALSMLVTLASTASGPEYSRALDAIYTKYTRAEIATYGGHRLSEVLVAQISRVMITERNTIDPPTFYDAVPFVLLAALPPINAQDALFVKLREEHNKTIASYGGGQGRLLFFLDIVQAGQGDEAATQRVIRAITLTPDDQREQYIRVLLEANKSVTHPAVLREFIPMLKDKEYHSFRLARFGIGPRYCDRAAELLYQSGGIDIGVTQEVISKRPWPDAKKYTDEELEQIEKRAREIFK